MWLEKKDGVSRQERWVVMQLYENIWILTVALLLTSCRTLCDLVKTFILSPRPSFFPFPRQEDSGCLKLPALWDLRGFMCSGLRPSFQVAGGSLTHLHQPTSSRRVRLLSTLLRAVPAPPLHTHRSGLHRITKVRCSDRQPGSY